jgi:Ca2+-binding RTX toxin-like protein
MIERIEKRFHLHSVFNQDGLLVINGVNGPDDIRVFIVGDNYHVNPHDGETFDFAISAVSGISLTGGTGDDTLVIAGDITIPTTILGQDGHDSITAGGHKDWIEGNAGHDTILGNGGRDMILGGDGDDVLSGGTKDDTLDGGEGKDFLVGSAGLRDQLTYESRSNGVNVSLDGAANDGEAGEDDNIAETLEWFRGGSGNDFMRGSGKANLLAGNDGDDTLIGGSGDDTIHGGAGRDSLSGQAGADRLEGQDGEIDTVSGGSAVDIGLCDSDDVMDSIP